MGEELKKENVSVTKNKISAMYWMTSVWRQDTIKRHSTLYWLP
jgi:hypothetical protein